MGQTATKAGSHPVRNLDAQQCHALLDHEPHHFMEVELGVPHHWIGYIPQDHGIVQVVVHLREFIQVGGEHIGTVHMGGSEYYIIELGRLYQQFLFPGIIQCCGVQRALGIISLLCQQALDPCECVLLVGSAVA
jgi:hypothetical protein